jgi:PAS domain
VYANRCLETATGYLRKDVIGTKFLSSHLVSCDIAQIDTIEAVSTALAKGKALKINVTTKRSDNLYRSYMLFLKPIFDETGNYMYMFSLQYDITSDGKIFKLSLTAFN